MLGATLASFGLIGASTSARSSSMVALFVDGSVMPLSFARREFQWLPGVAAGLCRDCLRRCIGRLKPQLVKRDRIVADVLLYVRMAHAREARLDELLGIRVGAVHVREVGGPEQSIRSIKRRCVGNILAFVLERHPDVTPHIFARDHRESGAAGIAF